MSDAAIALAILYQARPAPAVDGIVKPMKETGYADSGADIAVALRQMNVRVITPNDSPNERDDRQWVFPDTPTGIRAAIDRGTNTFWLNTVLYAGHAIEFFFGQQLYAVGQLPDMVQQYDDKWYTNELLRQHQLDLPPAHLLSEGDTLPACNFPLVLKPLRGRGSQGVQLIEDTIQLEAAIEKFFSSRSYGHKVVLETYLSGKEITTTVMPPGTYRINDKKVVHEKHWCLHPVERINHVNGITPYSGQVPVSANSHLMPMEVLKLPAMQRIIQQCAYAAERIDARAPIRIDSRADTAGTYRLFDVNLKPNMTGASRPHRAGQNSLSAIAAAALNWNYTDFIWNILQQRWLMK